MKKWKLNWTSVIRYFINQVGSQEELEEMAGKTVYQIKDDARESVKER